MSETVRIELSRADAEYLHGQCQAMMKPKSTAMKALCTELGRAVRNHPLAAAPDAPGEGVDDADVRLLVRMIDYLAEGQNEEYGGAKQGASAVEWALGDEMYPEMMAAYRKAAMQAAGAGEETR